MESYYFILVLYRMYTPLELQKLCCNIIIEHLYCYNYDNFLIELGNLDLPEIINKSIIDRYLVIKYIIKHQVKTGLIQKI